MPMHVVNEAGTARGAAFWSTRASRFGHTGWVDQELYAYDQAERLAVVKSVLPHARAPGQRALDFGCGSGDFSQLLLELGYAVYGYDPFVTADVRSINFTFTNRYEQFRRSQAIDVVLSVTTLDHILDEAEVSEALGVISTCLKRDGAFYMLEYALDSVEDRVRFGLRNDYQSFRTLTEWRDLLAGHGLCIVDVASVPHPHINPSQGYIAYAKHPLVRLRRHYPGLPMARAWCDPVLKRLATKRVDCRPSSTSSGSVLKLLRCSVDPLDGTLRGTW